MKKEEIEELLPAIFRRSIVARNEIMLGLLDVMESLHERAEAILNQLDGYFDPYRSPDEFVPFLAGWVDLDRFFDQSFRARRTAMRHSEPLSSGLGRLRELISRAAYLSKWRGTKKGMETFLELATGVAGFEVLDAADGTDANHNAFHIKVRVPDAARVHAALIDRIVRSEKPAHVTYDIEFMTPEPATHA